MSGTWLKKEGDCSCVLSLHVQPNARKTGFAGLHGESIKLRLAAPPVDGKANAALCAFIADFCDVAKSGVTLISGESARTKRVRICGISAETYSRLQALGNQV